QVVLLSGEAGIGKSRIVQTLRERLAGEPHATVLMQCSPYHRNSALYPLVQYFEHRAGIAPADSPEARAAKFERLIGPGMALSAASHGHLLRLLGAAPGDAVPPTGENPQQEKAQVLQAPVDLLRALARQVPVLMLIEDVHWIDPTTAELAALTIEQSRDVRLLILVTCRPEFESPWGNAANLTRLTLNRLGQRQSAELVDAVAGGRALPAEVRAEIIAKTDGIPLFVEELTKTVLQSGLLEEAPEGWRLRGPLPPLAIPSTLQDSLMSRLDRLAPAKEVAQVGAIIGREFSARLLGAVLRMAPERLSQALDELLRSELVQRRGVPPDESYVFRHALIRDTAYNSLLKGQRALRHAQIAAEIAALEPDTKASRPELLAYHCQEGGQTDPAFDYWLAAGDLAVARVALREAATHYRAALALLPRLGVTAHQRDAKELDLAMKLGHVLMQTEGYVSVATVASFARARELASQLGQSDTCVVACSAFGATLWASGRFDEGLALLESFGPKDLAALQPMSRVFRALVVGLIKFHLGALDEAHGLAQETLRELAAMPAEARQDVSGVDPRVVALTQAVAVSVQLGLLEQADAHTRAALQVAREREHPPTQSWAMSLERWMAYRHGDLDESIRLSKARLALTETLGFESQFGPSKVLLGRAMVALGQVDEGERLLQEGFAALSSDGSQTGLSEYAAIAADVLVEAGRTAEAERFLRAGEQAMADLGERFFAAELARLRARLLQHGGDDGAAEEGLRDALGIATRQGARLFALRAATDLARLLHQQGRLAEGTKTLQAALDAMPEGREQPDARRAANLLQALARATSVRD
ncbi:MAG: AAA family ATPase, partial [Piscinibacter sp.]|nr:AAA family ATPase [Piscinibacter sp.]